MTDRHKTKAQLITELAQLRERVAELETAEAARQRAESQREAALEALRDSQARLQRAESVAHFGNWELNLAERKMRASAGARAIYDLPGDEWPLADVQSVPLPEYRAILDAALANLIEHRQPYDVEFRIRRPGDGQLHDIHSMAEYDPDRRVVFGVIHDITARKQAEEALQTTLRRFQVILSSLYGGILVVSDDNRVEFVNQAFCDLLDLDDLPADLPGLSAPEMIQKITPVYADPPGAVVRIQEIVATGQPVKGEEIAVRGERTYLRDFIPIVIDGKRYGRLWHHQDITDRKRAEAALSASEARYRRLFEAAKDGILILDADTGLVTEVNPFLIELLGYSHAAFLGKKIWELGFFKDTAANQVNFRELQQQDYIRYEDLPLKTADGRQIDVEFVSNAYQVNHHKVIQCNIRDITARKQAEDELRANRRQLTDIIEFLPDATAALDREKRVILWNKAMEDMTGVPAAEMIGHGDYAYTIPFYGEARPSLVDLVFADQAELAARYPTITREGDTLLAEAFCNALYNHQGAWVTAKVSPLHDQFGNVIGAIESIRDITARKQTEAALRESEEKYRQLVDNANEVILVTQGDRLKFVNRMAIDLTGYSEQELLSTPFTEFIHPDDRSMVVERYLRRFQGDVFQDKYVFRLMTRGGSARWVEIGTVLIEWVGRPATLSFLSDITARKQAEEALRENELKLKTLFELLPVGVSVLDADSHVSYVNPALERILDITDAGLLRSDYRRRTYLRSDGTVMSTDEFASVRVVREQRAIYNVVTGVVKEDGQVVWTNVNAVPVAFPDWRIIIATTDITALKHAEEALRESEEKFREFFNTSRDCVFITSSGGSWIDFNDSAMELFGYDSRTDLAATPISQLYADAEERKTFIALIQRQGFVKEYPVKLKRKTGAEFDALITTSCLLNADGSTRGFAGTIRDITDRKQAEAALRESEEKYRNIFNNSVEGIFQTTPAGRYRTVNPAFASMFGYASTEDMIAAVTDIGQQLYVHPEDRQRLIALLHVSDGMVRNFETQLIRQDRSLFWVTINARLLQDSESQAFFIEGTCMDITARKQAEADLRESHTELQTRNEELDIFAHMVAHDLKNPLGAMMGYAELLTETYDTLSTEMIQETLNSINRIGRKASNIIESLFTLASIRKQDVPAAPLDMAHIVDEVLLRLADSIQDSGADLHVPDRADWPVALGHAPWIEEIWVNYLSNALKYGGPQPRIDLGAARLPPPSVTGEGLGGGFIRFSVRDYGPGLTPEQQERLFAPFERLGQAQVEGHGLGLSVVRHIAEKLGGQAGVDSQPGTLRGSTFYFTLPAAPD